MPWLALESAIQEQIEGISKIVGNNEFLPISLPAKTLPFYPNPTSTIQLTAGVNRMVTKDERHANDRYCA